MTPNLIVSTILNAPLAAQWQSIADAGLNFEQAIAAAPTRAREIESAYVAYHHMRAAEQAAQTDAQSVANRQAELQAYAGRQLAQGLEWAYGDDLSRFVEPLDQWYPKGTREILGTERALAAEAALAKGDGAATLRVQEARRAYLERWQAVMPDALRVAQGMLAATPA